MGYSVNILMFFFIFFSWFQENPDKYSMDELARSLIDSSVVLVFISDAFVQDEDCCNLFKYACLTLKKPILLVVIGTGMQWKQSKLGILITDEVRNIWMKPLCLDLNRLREEMFYLSMHPTHFIYGYMVSNL